MANEITENQRDKMRYRRIVIKDKLRNIEQLITGRAESFMPFICDENGHVTKEKIERFIKEMLGALRRYNKFDPNRHFDEKSEQLYESFLYCALMSLESERLKRDPGVMTWKMPSVFEDIVRRAESVDIYGCDSYNQYITAYYDYHYTQLEQQRKQYPFPISNLILLNAKMDSDFFIQLQRSLEKLGYPQFIECLTPKTLDRLRRDYNIRHNISENEEEQNACSVDPVDPTEKMDMPEVPVLKTTNYVIEEPAEEDYDADYEDWEPDYDYEMSLPQEDPDVITEREAKREEKERKIESIGDALKSLGEDQIYADNNKLRSYSQNDVRDVEIIKAADNLDEIALDWEKRYIFDKATLCGNYFRFLYLYFDNPDRKYFAEDIENMVDTFLFEHGISAFSLKGEDYAMINYCVDRAKDRLEREIARRKGK